MRRPRHREKSTLIYKMLGLAALAGLSLAPILMDLSASPHIAPLIPVQLVTVTPPKAPPAAPKPLPAVPKPAPAVVVAVKPAASSKPPAKPHVERVALLPPPLRAEHIPVAPPKPPGKPVVKRPAKPLTKRPAKPPVKSPPRPRMVKKTLPRTVKKTPTATGALHTAPASAARQALAARKARAAALEKQAHRIAVAMAARRANAAHTTSAAPVKPPVKTAARPPAKPVHVAVQPSPTPAPPPVTPSIVTPTETPGRPAAEGTTAEYVPAEALFQPQPTVPDSLLVAPLHAVFRCRFVIHPDGSATVQMVRSTGRAILDKRALAAARRWRFEPARRDGKPVESSRMVEMTFSVRPAFGG